MIPDEEDIVNEDTEGGKKGAGEDWMVASLKSSIRISEIVLETLVEKQKEGRFGSISDYRHQHTERPSDS